MSVCVCFFAMCMCMCITICVPLVAQYFANAAAHFLPADQLIEQSALVEFLISSTWVFHLAKRTQGFNPTQQTNDPLTD